MGRKAHYTPRIAARLCEHIALGATVKQALEREPLGPTATNFWRWLDEFPEFRDKYERARQMQADLIADNILEMAASVLRQPKFAPAYKVAADILKWQAEIRNPGKYGPKTTVKVESQRLSVAEMKAEIKTLEMELGIMDVPMLTINAEPETSAP